MRLFRYFRSPVLFTLEFFLKPLFVVFLQLLVFLFYSSFSVFLKVLIGCLSNSSQLHLLTSLMSLLTVFVISLCTSLSCRLLLCTYLFHISFFLSSVQMSSFHHLLCFFLCPDVLSPHTYIRIHFSSSSTRLAWSHHFIKSLTVAVWVFAEQR